MRLSFKTETATTRTTTTPMEVGSSSTCQVQQETMDEMKHRLLPTPRHIETTTAF
jgi:hypothetical protein